MTPTLEGMARAAWEMPLCSIPFNWQNASVTERRYAMEGMEAALLWLAENVTDEMVGSYFGQSAEEKSNIKSVISAAIRAAAGAWVHRAVEADDDKHLK